jgi:GH24 family phage-related lysozyme (muramidase)
MKTLPETLRITKPFRKIIPPEELDSAEKIVRSLVRDDLNDNQFSALVSFVLTTTRGTLARSILLQHCNDGFVFAAAAQFPNFTRRNGKHSKRLKTLRLKQKRLFLKPHLAVNNKEVKHGRD